MKRLKWKNTFRLQYGPEKHDQHLEPKTNATGKGFEQFSNKVPASWKKHIRLGE